MRTRGLAGVALAAALGCATTLPGHFVDPERSPHPDCDPQRFVVAVGSSPAGPNEARERAARNVVNKLGSWIEVESRRVIETSRKNGLLSSERTVTEKFEQRARFAHAELIRPVGATAELGRETHALACLDRAAASAALERDLAPSLAAFRASCRRAREATDRQDSAGFASAYRAATQAAISGLAVVAQLRALARPSTAEAELDRESADLVEQASRFRAAASFRLAVTGDVPDDLRRVVADAFRGALATVAREVRLADDCGNASRAVYLVRVRAEGDCRWGTLGHTCRPRFGVHAEQCTSGRVVLDASVHPAELGASDARDPERALRKAIRPLSAELIEPSLREAFAAELPL